MFTSPSPKRTDFKIIHGQIEPPWLDCVDMLTSRQHSVAVLEGSSTKKL